MVDIVTRLEWMENKNFPLLCYSLVGKTNDGGSIFLCNLCMRQGDWVLSPTHDLLHGLLGHGEMIIDQSGMMTIEGVKREAIKKLMAYLTEYVTLHELLSSLAYSGV